VETRHLHESAYGGGGYSRALLADRWAAVGQQRGGKNGPAGALCVLGRWCYWWAPCREVAGRAQTRSESRAAGAAGPLRPSRSEGERVLRLGWLEKRLSGPFLFSSFYSFLLFRFIHKKKLQIK
jgi:hypothetical protein